MTIHNSIGNSASKDKDDATTAWNLNPSTRAAPGRREFRELSSSLVTATEPGRDSLLGFFLAADERQLASQELLPTLTTTSPRQSILRRSYATMMEEANSHTDTAHPERGRCAVLPPPSRRRRRRRRRRRLVARNRLIQVMQEASNLLHEIVVQDAESDTNGVGNQSNDASFCNQP